MTLPAPDFSASEAVVDGVNVDAVAAVVLSCAGVSGLDGGQYGEVTTYLPGRAVQGVTVGDGRVRVQVRLAWGTEVPLLAAEISMALASLAGDRPVDVVIADIDDPPSASSGLPTAAAARPGPATSPRAKTGRPPV